jgi:hypothetical protein
MPELAAMAQDLHDETRARDLARSRPNALSQTANRPHFFLGIWLG